MKIGVVVTFGPAPESASAALERGCMLRAAEYGALAAAGDLTGDYGPAVAFYRRHAAAIERGERVLTIVDAAIARAFRRARIVAGWRVCEAGRVAHVWNSEAAGDELLFFCRAGSAAVRGIPREECGRHGGRRGPLGAPCAPPPRLPPHGPLDYAAAHVEALRLTRTSGRFHVVRSDFGRLTVCPLFEPGAEGRRADAGAEAFGGLTPESAARVRARMEQR